MMSSGDIILGNHHCICGSSLIKTSWCGTWLFCNTSKISFNILGKCSWLLRPFSSSSEASESLHKSHPQHTLTHKFFHLSPAPYTHSLFRFWLELCSTYKSPGKKLTSLCYLIFLYMNMVIFLLIRLPRVLTLWKCWSIS